MRLPLLVRSEGASLTLRTSKVVCRPVMSSTDRPNAVAHSSASQRSRAGAGIPGSSLRRPPLLDPGTQPQNGLRFQLRYPRLVKVNNAGDFTQRQLFVVVQAEHEALGFRHLVDSLREQSLQF